jgi:ABC-type nitrate/sulfonate/bicarbonate transport system substrate-binding protein
MTGLTRRTVLGTMAGTALTGAATVLPRRPARAADAKEITVSIGRQPWAAGNSPVTQYMMDNDLSAKQAAKAGYKVTTDYRDYPSAMPQVEAFVGGNLDFGMWGNTPIIRGIAQQQPWNILNIGEGHLRFVLATRPDSGIRNVQDLKGKTVGALLGGDPYNALSQILLAELGSGDPRANDIKIINTPTQAQAAAMPRGMDAAIVIYPAFLKAHKEVGTVGIVNSFGYTESYYKGPAGEGAGILLPSVKKSPFYPDGFYLHRSFWMVQNKLLSANPELVTAFVAAQQEAVDSLGKLTPEQISDLSKKYWGLPADLGAKVVEDEVLFIRGWVWPTEGDASALLAVSKFMVQGGLIDQALTWDQVKDAFKPGAPLNEKAWEDTGKRPPMDVFTAKDTKDLRGLPVWDMEKWSARS